VRPIEWTEPAIEDLAALDKRTARRIRQAVERFARSGAGDIKKLQGIEPPEFRLRSGDWRIRFVLRASTIVVLRVRNRKQAYR